MASIHGVRLYKYKSTNIHHVFNDNISWYSSNFIFLFPITMNIIIPLPSARKTVFLDWNWAENVFFNNKWCFNPIHLWTKQEFNFLQSQYRNALSSHYTDDIGKRTWAHDVWNSWTWCTIFINSVIFCYKLILKYHILRFKK